MPTSGVATARAAARRQGASTARAVAEAAVAAGALAQQRDALLKELEDPAQVGMGVAGGGNTWAPSYASAWFYYTPPPPSHRP